MFMRSSSSSFHADSSLYWKFMQSLFHGMQQSFCIILFFCRRSVCLQTRGGIVPQLHGRGSRCLGEVSGRQGPLGLRLAKVGLGVPALRPNGPMSVRDQRARACSQALVGEAWDQASLPRWVSADKALSTLALAVLHQCVCGVQCSACRMPLHRLFLGFIFSVCWIHANFNMQMFRISSSLF